MKKGILIFILGLLCACAGTVTDSSDGDPSSTENLATTAYLFGTDYISSGQLYSTGLDLASELSNTGVADLGSSATIRFFDGFIYVLHDGYSSFSSDNVQILDPSANFETVNQWSTGNGTNPQDIVVDGSTAYITLYNPTGDADNVDGSGNPADLIVMNLDTGSITTRISFYDYLEDDGYRVASTNKMVLVDGFLYVCLQQLEADYSPNTVGKILVIDTSLLTITQEIDLQGYNPVDIEYSADENRLYVAMSAGYGSYDYATDTHGGLEIVPLDDTDNTILISDDDLGGYIERVVVGDKIFVVASQADLVNWTFTSDIVSLPQAAINSADAETFVDNNSDVRDMGLDSNNRLWIARRSIDAATSTASDPQVDVFDATTAEALVTGLGSDVPITSIAFGE